MLSWIFGEVKKSVVYFYTYNRAAVYFEFEIAIVPWLLNIKETGKTNYRWMMLKGEEIEFINGFTDHYTESYKNVMDGKGCRISEALNAIRKVH